ncbi:MAG: SusD/RagB family nutrient-binding outer membrane lipoprotein [Bacteroidales bacterium]
MRTNIKNYLRALPAAILLLNASCTGNFDELNRNMNATTKVPQQMLVTNMLSFLRPGGQGSVAAEFQLTKYEAWIENTPSDLQYNIVGEANFDDVYKVLTNIEKMNALSNETTADTYAGFGLFLKTYYLFNLSAQVGDIPYSEALQGETGLLTPKYDTQEEVMKQIIADLDAAYEHFNKATTPLNGDFSDVGGDIDKWKRIVNLSELRVLINLSKKESVGGINVKSKFAEVAARPLLRSNDDNLKLSFGTAAGMESTWFSRSNNFYIAYQWLSGFFIDMLKKYDDYRLFYYAEPAKKAIDNGKTADDPDAYIGIDITETFDALDKECSMFNGRYNTVIGEPLSRMGYAEQCFILAEAAVRGWISGAASDYYNKGIEASMQYTRDYTAALETPDFWHGHEITDAYIAAHLNNPAVKLTGNTESDLEKVMEQKYIASFMQFFGNQFFDYRRTGLPKLPINPATNMNPVPYNDRLPSRYLYPQKERTTNLDNLDEAIKRQYPNGDDVNEIMWILK